MVRKQGCLREILHRVIERLREVLDEGTAAGGAGLIQHDVVDRTVLDADALHVLSADVQDAVDVRIKKFSGIVVGDRLDFPLVQHERGFDQRLTVTGRACACDLDSVRHVGINLLDRIDRRLERIALIAPVCGIEEFSVL